MNRSDKKLATRIIILCVVISVGTIALLTFCHPPFAYLGNICTYLPDFEIFIGVAIGTVTTGIFFWFIEKHQQELKTKLEELGEKYTERTALFNLLDVYSGKAHKIQPNEKNRQKYESMLEEYASRKEKDDELYMIWKNVEKHTLEKFDIKLHGRECGDCKRLDDDRDKHFKEYFEHQARCPKCIQLTTDIKKYLEEHKNPKQVE